MNKGKTGGFSSVIVWILKNKLLAIGILITAVYVIGGAFAPFVAPHNVNKAVPSIRLTKPFIDTNHILGTDTIGRDILSRVIFGVRTSLIIGIFSVALAVAFGVMIGICAGFSSPGPIDAILMRIADVQMGFPFIVLAIFVLTLAEPNELTITLVLSLSLWPAYARAAKSSVILQRDLEYITAARIMGASNWRIYTKYIGKNLLPAIVPLIPLDVAGMIICESLLSYMQMGIKPPNISIGSIMADARGYIASDAWFITVPGIVLVVMVLGLNFIGDSLQVKFDPKLQK